jgi:HK97 family phage prohead protease
MTQHLSVPLEIKATSGRKFEGHGAVFGNVDLGGDIVVKGAFARTLSNHTKAGTLPVMCWMHKPDMIPGVWTAMGEDSKGLFVAGELVDTPLGNEIKTLLDRKAVRGMSIGYQTVESDWRDDGIRLLKQVELHEVSIVSMAMNPLAQVEALKARLSPDGEYVPTEREFEHLLRKMGCSRAVAVTLTAKLFDGYGGGSGTLLTSPRGTLESTEDDEMGQLLQKLGALQDNVYATALKY